MAGCRDRFGMAVFLVKAASRIVELVRFMKSVMGRAYTGFP